MGEDSEDGGCVNQIAPLCRISCWICYFVARMFSGRTLRCRVCIGNENLRSNTCTESRWHLTELLRGFLCVSAGDPLWLHPHSRQPAHFNTFPRNTWHGPSVGPVRCKSINTDYPSRPLMAHHESNMTHPSSICISDCDMCTSDSL